MTDDPDDDDDDIVDPGPKPSFRKEVATAVAIAALSSLFSHLVEWGVDELKERFAKKKSKCASCTATVSSPVPLCAKCDDEKVNRPNVNEVD